MCPYYQLKTKHEQNDQTVENNDQTVENKIKSKAIHHKKGHFNFGGINQNRPRTS